MAVFLENSPLKVRTGLVTIAEWSKLVRKYPSYRNYKEVFTVLCWGVKEFQNLPIKSTFHNKIV